jgi:hypothetical protein
VVLTLTCAPALTAREGDHLLESGVVLQNREQAERLVAPCSRAAPLGVDSVAVARAEEVVAFEESLPTAMKHQSRAHPGWGPNKPLSSYQGQYAAFYRGGQRLVYGSFSPRSKGDATFHDAALVMCDGEGDYFGAVYNPVTGLVSEMSGNKGGVIQSK